MTDHPADTPRPSDADRALNDVLNPPAGCSVCGGEFSNDWTETGGCGVVHRPDCALWSAVAELRAARSLLADLKARGFIDECGTFPPTCWYCNATFERIYHDTDDGVDFRGEHADGCLWIRIQAL